MPREAVRVLSLFRLGVVLFALAPTLSFAQGSSCREQCDDDQAERIQACQSGRPVWALSCFGVRYTSAAAAERSARSQAKAYRWACGLTGGSDYCQEADFLESATPMCVACGGWRAESEESARKASEVLKELRSLKKDLEDFQEELRGYQAEDSGEIGSLALDYLEEVLQAQDRVRELERGLKGIQDSTFASLENSVAEQPDSVDAPPSGFFGRLRASELGSWFGGAPPAGGVRQDLLWYRAQVLSVRGENRRLSGAIASLRPRWLAAVMERADNAAAVAARALDAIPEASIAEQGPARESYERLRSGRARLQELAADLRSPTWSSRQESEWVGLVDQEAASVAEAARRLAVDGPFESDPASVACFRPAPGCSRPGTHEYGLNACDSAYYVNRCDYKIHSIVEREFFASEVTLCLGGSKCSPARKYVRCEFDEAWSRGYLPKGKILAAWPKDKDERRTPESFQQAFHRFCAARGFPCTDNSGYTCQREVH